MRYFKTCTGWKCEAGMRITDELTAFATAHLVPCLINSLAGQAASNL
jgi:hypothetical protein